MKHVTQDVSGTHWTSGAEFQYGGLAGQMWESSNGAS